LILFFHRAQGGRELLIVDPPEHPVARRLHRQFAGSRRGQQGRDERAIDLNRHPLLAFKLVSSRIGSLRPGGASRTTCQPRSSKVPPAKGDAHMMGDATVGFMAEGQEKYK